MSIDHVNLADPDAFVGGVPHEVFTRLRAEAKPTDQASGCSAGTMT